MNNMVNIGFGNVVNSDRVVGIVHLEAAPIKRMVQTAKDSGMAIDATCGRKGKSVLIMDSGHIMLSAMLPETIAKKMNSYMNI